jgi:transcriptional regulator with XRE-family HTH domain
MNCLSVHDAWMPSQRHREPPPEVFIGEWLHALDIRPREVSKGARVNEGYLSQLISGQKVNASAAMVKRIGDYLGIDWRKLYERPPNREILRAASKLDPAILARFRKEAD